MHFLLALPYLSPYNYNFLGKTHLNFFMVLVKQLRCPLAKKHTDLSELEATVQSSWNWTLGGRWDRPTIGDSSSVYNSKLPLLPLLEFTTFIKATESEHVRDRWLIDENRFHLTLSNSLSIVTTYSLGLETDQGLHLKTDHQHHLLQNETWM